MDSFNGMYGFYDQQMGYVDNTGLGYSPYMAECDPFGNPYGNPYGGAYQQQHVKKTTKRDILNYLMMQAGTQDIVQVDDFETPKARHICKGTKEIKVLDMFTIGVPTTEGMLNVRYFLCPMCRRLIIDKQSLEMI